MSDAEIKDISAMILAAGFGERMRPLTNDRPKPSLPVLGTSLLSRIIYELRHLGITTIAVNGHHHSDRIRSIAQQAANKDTFVEFFHEPTIMGTGGALSAPSALLSRSPYFLTHNGDTLCHVPLNRLRRALDDDTCVGALLVRPGRHRKYNPILTRGPFFRALYSTEKEPADEFAVFLGVALWKRIILEEIPANTASDILRDTVLPMLCKGQQLAVVPYDGPWLEFTDPQSYKNQICEIIAGGGVVQTDLPGAPTAIREFGSGRAYVSPTAELSSDCRLEGSVAIESGAIIRSGAVLVDSVILENATVEKNVSLRNAIVAPNAVVRTSDQDCVIQPGGRTGFETRSR